MIYPVDAKGNCRSADTSSTEGPFGLNDATQDVFSTLNLLADVTGGRVTKYDDDLSKGVTSAANDLRGTYTVGFYIADEPDDRWHPIQLDDPPAWRHPQAPPGLSVVRPRAAAESGGRLVGTACQQPTRVQRDPAERQADAGTPAGDGAAANRGRRSVFSGQNRAGLLPTWKSRS